MNDSDTSLANKTGHFNLLTTEFLCAKGLRHTDRIRTLSQFRVVVTYNVEQ